MDRNNPGRRFYLLKTTQKNIEYIVGIHADVTEDTPIKLTAYDGEKTDAEP